MRAELLKFRTIRAPWVLLGAAQLLVIAGVAGPMRAGAGEPGAVTGGLAHLGLAALFPLVLGVMAVAGEHRHRTITDTYLGTPRRARVLAGKLAVTTAAGLLFGLVGAVTGLSTAYLWLTAEGLTLDLGDSEVWRTLGGGVAWNVAFAALGTALGALVRNLTGALVAALAWLALVETVVAQLFGSAVAEWLPFAAGSALGRLPLPADGLSQWAGGLVLAGYTVVLTVAAVVVTARRDVG